MKHRIGTTAAVNKERYVGMLEKLRLMMAENSGIDTDTMWFQLDRALAHASKDALSWLEDYFGERVVNVKTLNPSPAHSPDLTPLDFHL